jgi:hypothetical protein
MWKSLFQAKETLTTFVLVRCVVLHAAKIIKQLISGQSWSFLNI